MVRYKRRERRYTSERCNGGKNYLVWDNKTGECIGFIAQIVGRLNLQNDTIKDQQDDIKMLNDFLVEKGLAEEFFIWKREKSDGQKREQQVTEKNGESIS